MIPLAIFSIILSSNPSCAIPTTTTSASSPTGSTTMAYHSIRLIGGRHPYEGRVEVYHDGQFGTICDDLWDQNEAQVVCSQLGYGVGHNAAVSLAKFGEGSGKIWLDNVKCSGSEQHLGECAHDPWGVTDCSHSEDAGVVCAVDCGFEVDECGWKSVPAQGFDIKNEAFIAMLPRYKADNKVLFAAPSSFPNATSSLNTSKVQLFSPYAYKHDSCVTFVYFTSHAALSVAVQKESVWKASKYNSSNEDSFPVDQTSWLEGQVQLKSHMLGVSDYVQLIFNVEFEAHEHAFAVIDDIRFHEALCTASCDFEKDICGWVNGQLGHGWKRDQYLEPNADKRNMYYIQSTGSNVPSDEVVILQVPIVSAGHRCLQFEYSIFGSSKLKVEVNSHRVFIVNSSSKDSLNLETKGTRNVYRYSVFKSSSFGVTFLALHPKNTAGEITLDNVEILPYSCDMITTTSTTKNMATTSMTQYTTVEFELSTKESNAPTISKIQTRPMLTSHLATEEVIQTKLPEISTNFYTTSTQSTEKSSTASWLTKEPSTIRKTIKPQVAVKNRPKPFNIIPGELPEHHEIPPEPKPDYINPIELGKSINKIDNKNESMNHFYTALIVCGSCVFLAILIILAVFTYRCLFNASGKRDSATRIDEFGDVAFVNRAYDRDTLYSGDTSTSFCINDKRAQNLENGSALYSGTSQGKSRQDGLAINTGNSNGESQQTPQPRIPSITSYPVKIIDCRHPSFSSDDSFSNIRSKPNQNPFLQILANQEASPVNRSANGSPALNIQSNQQASFSAAANHRLGECSSRASNQSSYSDPISFVAGHQNNRVNEIRFYNESHY